MSGWDVRLEPTDGANLSEDRWRRLASVGGTSYFQSWGWIESWLNAVPGGVRLHCILASRGDELAGIGIVGSAGRAWTRRLRPRALHLGETGRGGLDAISVEHNGFLASPDRQQEAVDAILGAFAAGRLGADRLFVSGIDAAAGGGYVESAQRLGLAAEVRWKHPTFEVDLGGVAGDRGSVLSRLGTNTRQQIRRSIRRYETRGELVFEAAENRERALELLDRLIEGHQRHWQARGQPGAFATPFARRLHHHLVTNRFEHGEIQLAGVRAGETPIGYLYNFVLDGVVTNYQGAFVYEADNRLKPGLVSHMLAIAHNAALGHRVYDLLAGDQRYKRSLCTRTGEMWWLVIDRPSLRLDAYRSARRAWRGAKRALRRVAGRNATPVP